MNVPGSRLFARLAVLSTVVGFAFYAFAGPPKTPAKGPAPVITIALDAREAPRKIFHARLTIPASAGTLTLYYPKWIPGEHGPTGPIQDLAGLKFTANGQELNWRRDLLDGWTFHVEVPAGVTNVEASLDFLSPTGRGGIYTGGASATDKMTVISWNTALLYPEGWTSDEVKYQASVRLPEGWKYATSLAVASNAGNEVRFQPFRSPCSWIRQSSRANTFELYRWRAIRKLNSTLRPTAPLPSSPRSLFSIPTNSWWIRHRSYLARITIATTTSSTASAIT